MEYYVHAVARTHSFYDDIVVKLPIVIVGDKVVREATIDLQIHIIAHLIIQGPVEKEEEEDEVPPVPAEEDEPEALLDMDDDEDAAEEDEGSADDEKGDEADEDGKEDSDEEDKISGLFGEGDSGSE